MLACKTNKDDRCGIREILHPPTPPRAGESAAVAGEPASLMHAPDVRAGSEAVAALFAKRGGTAADGKALDGVRWQMTGSSPFVGAVTEQQAEESKCRFSWLAGGCWMMAAMDDVAMARVVVAAGRLQVAWRQHHSGRLSEECGRPARQVPESRCSRGNILRYQMPRHHTGLAAGYSAVELCLQWAGGPARHRGLPDGDRQGPWRADF